MIDRLNRPLKRSHAAAAALALSGAVALYCLAYTALAGGSESPARALGWAIVNVLPWAAAFEAGKRCRRIASRGLVLGAALAASLALGIALGQWGGFGFEVARRLPGLLAAAAALLAAAALSERPRRRVAAESIELPLPPDRIDWIAAAGNYVELHGAGRVLLHRAPLSLVEAQLEARGFVRIHRSTLVRRDRIARIRPLDLVLLDGTVLRIGKRYRARVGRGNFDPSSLRSGEPAPETP
jgi:hypothetical protein